MFKGKKKKEMGQDRDAEGKIQGCCATVGPSDMRARGDGGGSTRGNPTWSKMDGGRDRRAARAGGRPSTSFAGGKLGGLGEADLVCCARLECEGGCKEMQQQNSIVEKGVRRRVKRRRRIVIAASTC